ncbi:MAG: hypothetical protein R2867_15990 [Caldilineaceae bacterium]
MAAARYVFVLWGRNFDGAAATIFVSELRQAGLRVKVVGLDGELPIGMHGVTLVPDIPLSKALSFVGRTAGIIVPCHACHWPRIQQDPRLVDFLVGSRQSNALLIVAANCCAGALGALRVVDALAAPIKATMPVLKAYPSHEELTEFARGLAGELE